SSQRRVTRLIRQQLRIDRVGRHDGLPFGPLGIPDAHRDPAAECHAVAYPPDDLDLVLLELHPSATPVTKTTPGQLCRNVGTRNVSTSRDAVEHRDKRRPMRLTRSQPPQHAISLARCIIASQNLIKGFSRLDLESPSAGG